MLLFILIVFACSVNETPSQYRDITNPSLRVDEWRGSKIMVVESKPYNLTDPQGLQAVFRYFYELSESVSNIRNPEERRTALQRLYERFLNFLFKSYPSALVTLNRREGRRFAFNADRVMGSQYLTTDDPSNNKVHCSDLFCQRRVSSAFMVLGIVACAGFVVAAVVFVIMMSRLFAKHSSAKGAIEENGIKHESPD